MTRISKTIEREVGDLVIAKHWAETVIAYYSNDNDQFTAKQFREAKKMLPEVDRHIDEIKSIDASHKRFVERELERVHR